MINQQEIKKIIQEKRKDYNPSFPPEMKKGSRFYSDEKVINKLRNMYFESKDYQLNRLPRIDQVPEKYIIENINKCFDDLCFADWNYTNPDKWN